MPVDRIRWLRKLLPGFFTSGRVPQYRRTFGYPAALRCNHSCADALVGFGGMTRDQAKALKLCHLTADRRVIPTAQSVEFHHADRAYCTHTVVTRCRAWQKVWFLLSVVETKPAANWVTVSSLTPPPSVQVSSQQEDWA